MCVHVSTMSHTTRTSTLRKPFLLQLLWKLLVEESDLTGHLKVGVVLPTPSL